MRISLNWLKELVDIDLGVDDLAHQLTMLGLEIESVERPGEGLSGVLVGQIQSIEPHPDADKLVVCKTDVGGEEPLQIVCGAKNMSVGDKVPTAIVGATLAGGFAIKGRKMRGVESQGMMCSADELGMGEDHSGLFIMDPETPVGVDALPLLGLDDVIFEIEVTPNRGDWAGMIGVARELAALRDGVIRPPEAALNETSEEAASLSSVTIEDPDLCPRYLGRVITGVKIGPSPAWLCQRLFAAGQRPINNIVDITNLVLLETGHPLHAFDYQKLAENRIVVRRARKGEPLKTLDDQDRALVEDMLVIADAKKPVALAGVMGGADSEVGEGTQDIFLESAYFNPVSIRRTARALGMNTEASQRFQRGADPEMAVYALDRAAALIQDIAGGSVAAGRIDAHPNPQKTKEIKLRYNRSDLLLGTKVAPEAQRDILAKLCFGLVAQDEDSCTVSVPSWRHDVTQEADLIEEIARVHGYERMETTLPRIRQADHIFAPQEKPIRELRAFLTGHGLTEVMAMTFSNPQDVEKASLADARGNMVTLENPLSENHATMRSSLIPGMLSLTSLNLRHGAAGVAVFELGPVYTPDSEAELPKQSDRLAMALTGLKGAQHWSLEAKEWDFYDLKGYTQALLDHLEAPCSFEEMKFSHLQAGQSAAITLKDNQIGSLGLINKEVGEAFDIEHPLYLLDLDLSGLIRPRRTAAQFSAPPAFPPSLRDMALILDVSVPAGDVAETAQTAGGKILKKVDIFDVYKGEQVPKGKKSVALSLVFQSEDRTLTDKDTQKSFDRILKRLKDDFQAELR